MSTMVVCPSLLAQEFVVPSQHQQLLTGPKAPPSEMECVEDIRIQ